MGARSSSSCLRHWTWTWTTPGLCVGIRQLIVNSYVREWGTEAGKAKSTENARTHVVNLSYVCLCVLVRSLQRWRFCFVEKKLKPIWWLDRISSTKYWMDLISGWKILFSHFHLLLIIASWHFLHVWWKKGTTFFFLYAKFPHHFPNKAIE